MPSILLFGATGQMGSHLVLALRKAHPTLPLTVYLRSASIDTYLTATVGVSEIVHGDFSQLEKIAAVAVAHDIVINMASSWDVPLTKAIIAGLRQRPAGATSTLIHISGAGNFIDTTTKGGQWNPESKLYNDANEDDMKLINASMLNGGPDVEVLEAGKDGRIGTYIVFPSGVYGASAGPVKALGVIQLLMTLKAKELGFVPYVGPGSSLFNTVSAPYASTPTLSQSLAHGVQIHVRDIAPFVLKVLERAMTGGPEGSVYSRCYILGSNDHTWKEVSTAFAKVFHARGLIAAPEAKSIRREEGGEGEIVDLMAGNVNIKCDRAVALGFKPVQPTLLEHLQEALADYEL
ncbi:hypothetical protein MMC17_010070 [Xylographa soralifera]|nr:hypothetical protein [Xylographa soralifera]